MLPIAFTFPWILAALIGLPLLWRILRAAPPPPRTVRFPGVFFLYGLQNREETPGVTPLWLLILRTLLVIVLLLAAAGPVWRGNQVPAPATRPLIVLIDNSATATPGWTATLDAAERLIAPAFSAGRPVFWTALAPAPDGTLPGGLLSSQSWQQVRQTHTPQPWLADVRAVTRQLRAQTWPEAPELWLLSSGYLPRPFSEGWLAALAENGTQVHLLLPDANSRPRAALTGLSWNGTTAEATLTRLAPTALPLMIELRNKQGEVLATVPATASEDAPEQATARLRLPADQAASVRQARIAGESTVAGLWLTGGGWGAPPVGLLSTKAESQTRSLLDELHYLRQALSLSRRTVTGTPEAVLAAGSQVILWPDAVVLNARDRKTLMQFVAKGGTLVRFAGETLATARRGDELLPVRLRPGKRALGGGLGETPPRLTAFQAGTPLAGLPVPSDVTVKTQVLPEPVADLPAHVWASLSDGTPLVTGKRAGRGWLVLVQTTATPVWSTLAYSGAFPAILDQLAQLGDSGNGGLPGGADLGPWRVLNAEGQLMLPNPGTASLPSGTDLPAPSPQHPPGLYGDGGRLALNVGPEAAARLAPIEALWSGRVTTSLTPEQRLAPALLAAAFMLLLVDLVATLALRGGLWRGSVVVGAILVLMGTVSAARAAPADPLDFLAYLPSGDTTVDQVTEAGLTGLTKVLSLRTAAGMAPPRMLGADAPELPLAPVVYLALAADLPTFTAAEREGLRYYLQHGGLLFIDTRSAADPVTQAARMQFVRNLLADLGIADVAPVPKDHVLTRTFYILEQFPGRWTAGTLALPTLPEDLPDPVAPVIVGSNDYAAAWAVNAAGNPLFPTLPQGAWQRERALRTGVNVVLYALTGTYKNDQIHLKAILERLE